MAITLSTSNSYVTAVSTADTYFEQQLSAVKKGHWADAGIEEKKAALVEATQLMDLLNYVNDKATTAQALQFPRGSDTAVPTDIARACMELAAAIVDDVDADLEFENLGITAQSQLGTKTTYNRTRLPDHLVAGIPSIRAWRLIFPYLRRGRVVQLDRVS